MKRLTATYLKGASGPSSCPPPSLPEIALAGRSNVGKSSFLNAICGRPARQGGAGRSCKDLARVSKTPGRTRDLHFFDTDAGFRLVDLPGYGFASASKGEMNRWKAMLEEFFRTRTGICLVISLIDSRHGATKDDIALHGFLRDLGLNWEPVATKIDKLKQGERAKNLEALRLQLGLSYKPLVFSAVTGEGRERVLGHMKACAGGYRGNPAA